MKINRQIVFNKFYGRCAYCGLDLEYKSMQVDHLLSQRNFAWHIENQINIPKHLLHLTEYDVNHIDNLMPACRSCNNFKSTFDIETFRLEIESQIDRLRKYKPTVNLAERYGLLNFNPKPVVFYFEQFIN